MLLIEDCVPGCFEYGNVPTTDPADASSHAQQCYQKTHTACILLFRELRQYRPYKQPLVDAGYKYGVQNRNFFFSALKIRCVAAELILFNQTLHLFTTLEFSVTAVLTSLQTQSTPFSHCGEHQSCYPLTSPAQLCHCGLSSTVFSHHRGDEDRTVQFLQLHTPWRMDGVMPIVQWTDMTISFRLILQGVNSL